MRKLILGAGKNQRIEGAEHHDQYPFPGIDHVFDLNGNWFPEGLKEGYNLITCDHVIEHLHSLTNFMNNCHMILKPDGWLELTTPTALSIRVMTLSTGSTMILL